MQDLLAFLEDTWHLSEPALRDVVSSGLQRAHIPFLKGTAQWDSWFSTLGDNAVACKWAEEQLAAGATLTGSFGTGPEDWTCLSGSVRGELEREGIDSVAKLAFLTDAQLRRLGMEESERVLVAQLRKEVQEGARGEVSVGALFVSLQRLYL